MSSRVVRLGNADAASSLPWREVRHGGAMECGAGAPADWQAQISDLQQAIETRAREAHSAGFREGEAAARNRAQAEMQAAMERSAKVIDELSSLRGRLRREAEADVLRLSLAIARRVLRRELAADPDALHGIVVAALEKLQGHEICRVKVHPSHAPSLSSCLKTMRSGALIEVIADPSRQPGSILFETERGNLDASIESQLQEIERGLIERLRRQS